MTDNLNFSVENIEEKYNNITENSTTEITGYTDYNRVNFDDPASILKYGTDLLNEMGILMKNVSTMMRRDDLNLNELTEKIDKLSTFNNELDKLDEKKQQQLVPNNSLIKKVTSLLKQRLGMEEESLSYADEFEKYTENLDVIASYVEEQKNNTIADINMHKEFVKQMKPYEIKLNELINLGEQDLADYKKKIDDLEKEIVNGQSDHEINEIKLARQKMEIFSRKLEELKKNLVLIKNTIAECELKQGPDMELVFMYDSYVHTTIPVLKVQATSMVGVRRQASALASHKQLVDATNEAAKKNSELLVGNIQAATDLSIEGNIKMETLKELEKNIQEGIKILKDGTAKRIATREKNQKVLEELNASLNETNAQMVGVLNQEAVSFPEIFESHSYPKVSDVQPKQKTLGIFNSGK